MELEHGLKTKYDYVELYLEQQPDRCVLKLHDLKRDQWTTHEENCATLDDAKRLAKQFAEHYISIRHNDTLLGISNLNWQEY